VCVGTGEGQGINRLRFFHVQESTVRQIESWETFVEFF